MPVDVLVTVQEKTDVAVARRAALEMAGLAGLKNSEMGAVGLIATEAATNLIKHGGGGEIVVRQLRGSEAPVLELLAWDRGKGMDNPAHCFEDGYSTAGSPGTGLGAIARLASFHQVYSHPGAGTVLMAHVGTPAPEHAWFEMGAISVPYPGEPVCGDAWNVRASHGHCRLMLADGLGHGLYAWEAASRAVEALQDPESPGLVALLEEVHGRLRSTRGAAVAVVDLDAAAGTLTFAGVGNVAGSVVSGAERRQMVSMNGTVGHGLRKLQQYRYLLPPDALVILHSDGLSANWSLEKYPGLRTFHASVIAAVLLRDFRRVRDDATVVVFHAAGFTA